MKFKKAIMIMGLCIYGLSAHAGDYSLQCSLFTFTGGVDLAMSGKNGLGRSLGIKFEGYKVLETKEHLSLKQMLSDDFVYNENSRKFTYKGKRVTDYISIAFPVLENGEAQKSSTYYMIPEGYQTSPTLFKKDHLHQKYILTTKKDSRGELWFSVKVTFESKYTDTLEDEIQDFEIPRDQKGFRFSLKDNSDLVDEILNWNIPEFSSSGKRHQEFWNEVAIKTPEFYPKAHKIRPHSDTYRVPQKFNAGCDSYYY